MKFSRLALFAVVAVLPASCLCSCGTGTTVTFGKGGIVVTPPSEPIVFPTK